MSVATLGVANRTLEVAKRLEEKVAEVLYSVPQSVLGGIAALNTLGVLGSPSSFDAASFTPRPDLSDKLARALDSKSKSTLLRPWPLSVHASPRPSCLA